MSSDGQAAGGRRPLALLRVDPDLARAVPGGQAAVAEARLRVPRVVIDAGGWEGPEHYAREGLGLLIVHGVLKRTLAVAGLPCTELLGAGDLVQPAVTVDDSERSRGRPDWAALERVELAFLDETFVMACAAWPSIVAALVARVVERGHWRTSIRSAIGQTRRIDDRLLLLLWHFSQRWGTVRGDGVCVHLPVTHDTLAQLVGATRSAVTTGLARLERRGVLSRPGDDAWLLRGEAPSFAGPW